MRVPGAGNDSRMSHDDPDDQAQPTADHPLHGERRPVLTPALAVIAVFVVVAAVFAVITWLRYST